MAGRREYTRREVNLALLSAAIALAAGPRLKAAPSCHLFDFAIAGGFHHGLEAALPHILPGQILNLRREPRNAHDPNAIAVDTAEGLMLGYVPRAANVPVAKLLDADVAVRATVVRMLNFTRTRDIPDDLVFTAFASGDPMIRLET